MKEFACIGGDCEDTCCGGWRVSLTKRDYSKIRTRMSNGRLQQFKAVVIRTRKDALDGEFARVELDEKGNCGFLDCDSLCSLQKDFGPSVLPKVCAVYPRLVSLVGSRIELTGTLSCPEAARKCLLHSDAVELVDSSPDDLPLQKYNQHVNVEAADPYTAYFDDIRSLFYQLLRLDEFDFQTRLYFVSYFAKITAPFFGAGTENFSEERLARAVKLISEPATLLELADQFNRLEVPPAIAGAVIDQALGARLAKLPNPRFRRLLDEACLTYVDSGDEKPDLDRVWEDYVGRVAFWQDQRRNEIDRYFTNYSVAHLMANPYVTWPDLTAYVRQMIVRVALLRFIFFSDPALLECSEKDDVSLEVLDRTAVKVFYLFSRNIEHNFTFLTDLATALDEQGYNSFAHVVCLARF